MDVGFATCSTYSTCPILNVDFRCSPAPTAHVHLDQTICILLFKKSETLLRLPLSPPIQPNRELLRGEKANKDVKTASDPHLPSDKPGRGKGRFPSTLYPVRIPSANQLLEAYTLLMIRDRGQIYEHFWSAMLSYLREYVEETGLIMHQELEPWCRALYGAMFASAGPLGAILDKLKSEGVLVPCA